MAIETDQKLLSAIIARANIVWEEAPFAQTRVSEILGSSPHDHLGKKIWSSVKLGSFIAPNFYLNKDEPRLLTSLNCAEVGTDMDDRPLLYFFENGKYAVSSDIGLLFIASSTIEFFDVFITFAEWVEELIASCGANALVEHKFSGDDLNRLSLRFTTILGDKFEDSFWEREIEKRRSGCKKRCNKTPTSFFER